MEATEKKFSKEKWLKSAYEQMKNGYLSQREIDDACKLWVDRFDGLAKSEIKSPLNDEWFE